MNILRRKRRLLIETAIWALLLIVFSLSPQDLVFRFLPRSYHRDLAHVFVYVVFSFLLCLYLIFKRHLGPFRMTDGRAMAVSFIAAALWGGLNEIIQRFTPDRVADLGDLRCDLIGAAIGLVFFALFKRVGHWLPAVLKPSSRPG